MMADVVAYQTGQRQVYMQATVPDTTAQVPYAVPYVATYPGDEVGAGIRSYDFAGQLRVAFGATSTDAIALPTMNAAREILVQATQRVLIRFGGAGVAAAEVAAGHLMVGAGQERFLRAPAGATHFRAIRDTADGFVVITPLA